VLSRRCIVEGTFARIVKNRRLIGDHEQLTAIAASATLLLR
jgi:hypothetical protein